jgi:hypothetical protein
MTYTESILALCSGRSFIKAPNSSGNGTKSLHSVDICAKLITTRDNGRKEGNVVDPIIFLFILNFMSFSFHYELQR